MEVTARNTVFEGKYVRIVEKTFRREGRPDRVWESVERRNVHGRGAVVIIAVTADGELLFEKNWRAPTESYVIQFPAGLTDLEGESEEDAARRELLEETGYAAGKLILVISSPLSPALASTRAMHYFAPDVWYVGEVSTDDAEEIEVVRVPLGSADEFMRDLPPGVELDLRVPGVLLIMRNKGLI